MRLSPRAKMEGFWKKGNGRFTRAVEGACGERRDLIPRDSKQVEDGKRMEEREWKGIGRSRGVREQWPLFSPRGEATGMDAFDFPGRRQPARP